MFLFCFKKESCLELPSDAYEWVGLASLFLEEEEEQEEWEVEKEEGKRRSRRR